MKNNIKYHIGLALIIIAFIAIIAAGIWSTIFYFQNPDMTELRRFLENPAPAIIGLVSLIPLAIGYKLND